MNSVAETVKGESHGVYSLQVWGRTAPKGWPCVEREPTVAQDKEAVDLLHAGIGLSKRRSGRQMGLGLISGER